MVKRAAKRLLILFGGLVVLFVLATAYTQTQFFRDQIRSFVHSYLDSVLDAEVYVGRIGGNLITGISVDSLSVRVDSVSVLTVRHVEAEYDLFSAARQLLRIHHVRLVQPEIHMETGRDGQWNFLRMIRPTPGDTTGSGPFGWTIILDRLELIDGSFALVDSATLLDPDHTPPDSNFIEYHDLHVGSIQLELAAEVSPWEKKVIFRKLSARAASPSFELRQLLGEITVSGDEASVRNLTILTGHSTINLDASLKEFDLLGGIDLFSLESRPVELILADSDISLNELAMFIRDIDFLNGTVSTHLEAGGTFGDLNIRALHLDARQTEFHVTGNVFNLHDPGNLYLDLAFSNSALHSDDARWILPRFDLPDLASLGLSRFDLKFSGRPLDFNTTIDLSNQAGLVDVDAHLAIGGPGTLKYEGSSDFQRMNLAPLVPGGDSATSLNGKVVIAGSGVDLEHLKASVNLSLDSSRFFGNVVYPSRFNMDVTSDHMEGTVNLAMGSLQAELVTKFDGLTESHPSFDLLGSVSALNIAELSHQDIHRTDLSMTLDARGEGLTPSDVSGEFRLDLVDSRYEAYLIDSATVRLSIDQRKPLQKSIHLESDLADLNIEGAFDLAYLVDLIRFEQQNLKAAINQKFAILESSLPSPAERGDLDSLAFSLRQRNQVLDMEFEISIKDLEPLSILAGEMSFDGIGTLRGTAVGDFNELSFSANLSADEMFYGTSESGFYIKDGIVDFQIENLKPLKDPFGELNVRFFTEADELNIGVDRFDSLAMTLIYRNGDATYDASGLYGTDLGFVFDGTALVSRNAIVFEPDDLHINIAERGWSLQDGASIEFRRDGADFRDIVMASDTQEVRLSGTVASNGALNGALSINRIGLDVFEGLLDAEGGSRSGNFMGGSASVKIDAGGTVTDPRLVASLEARDVAFRGLPFGEVRGKVEYEKGKTAINLIVSDDLELPDAAPKLEVTGFIPVRLPFADVDDRYSEGFDLHVMSSGIQINFLDPLVPTFDQLSGILRCDLTLSGRPEELNYNGTFSLNDCMFLFEPNNMTYRFSGEFHPSGNRIVVIQAVAENIQSDNRPGRSGRMHFAGDFALKEFVPTDFNLVAQGELLVVKPESRSSSLPVYGDLYIETGAGGLHFTGQIEKSLLRGNVLVQRSRLIFPPARSSARGPTESSVPVVVIDDTSTVVPDSIQTFRDRYFIAGSEVAENPKKRNENRNRKSFLDGVEYDLNVETSGPSSEIKLIFSEIPAEDMQANFQGKWSITGDGTRWIGKFDIDRAQYTFFKQFDATGSLRYTGEFMNPELYIIATYQSTRTVQSLVDSSTKTERVVVSLKITGTRNEPRHEMSMTIDDIDYYSYFGPKSSDLESDAIAFILVGNFPLSRSESSNIASNIEASVGASMMVGASSVLTKELSEYLRRETGFITSVELGYEGQGSFSQSADIRLSGTAFKGYWRYRGTILDNPFSNANVSLLYSFGDIFSNPSLRNFMFELERSAETGTTGLIDDRKEINSARLFYRFSF